MLFTNLCAATFFVERKTHFSLGTEIYEGLFRKQKLKELRHSFGKVHKGPPCGCQQHNRIPHVDSWDAERREIDPD